MATLKIDVKPLMPIALMAALCLLLPADTLAQNLLKNGDFSEVNSLGPQSVFTRTSAMINSGGSQSGAQYWTTAVPLPPDSTRAYTVATDWVASNIPGDTGKMLEVETDVGGAGIVNSFIRPRDTGPEEATACVWLLLMAGKREVCVGIGNSGDTHPSMCLREKNKWERITVSNGISPANQLIIYGQGPGKFAVRYAEVQKGSSLDQDGCCSPAEFLESPEAAAAK